MNQAVLVIDVQSCIFDAVPAPADSGVVIGNINCLTAWARAAHIPVIMVQHEQPDTPIAYQSAGWQLQAGLQQAESDLLVRKTTPDSFLNTNLAELLAKQEIKELIVCGYASEFCVDTTVRSAAARGFAVTIAADAHTTQDKAHAKGGFIREHHNRTLSAIRSFGVPIQALNTANIVGEMKSAASMGVAR
ncbi:cysteine hydrolase family protein [Pseudoalteromonas fenneropenaei]|uniref:Cysteine hydrolase family protein n=1 Tax=Pseudoalteromonas fenneropenaei TaxID=1737459 RepID=A0ABV7CN30_9GAMM